MVWVLQPVTAKVVTKASCGTEISTGVLRQQNGGGHVFRAPWWGDGIQSGQSNLTPCASY